MHESATATVVIDHSTQAPQLTSPAGGATVSGALGVGYALPEAAQAGSVALVLTPAGGGTAHTLTLTNAAAGAASVTIDRSAPASSPGVAAASPASPIADGTYDVGLRYRDVLGNPEATAAATGVVLTTPAETPAPTRTPGMVGTTGAAADRTAPTIAGARIVAKTFTRQAPVAGAVPAVGGRVRVVRPAAPAPRRAGCASRPRRSARPPATPSSGSRAACAGRATG